MDNDNVITPHLIRWTPGVREIDTYCQDPSPENLDRLIQFFKTQEGENNLATKLLSVTLPRTPDRSPGQALIRGSPL